MFEFPLILVKKIPIYMTIPSESFILPMNDTPYDVYSLCHIINFVFRIASQYYIAHHHIIPLAFIMLLCTLLIGVCMHV